MKSAMANLDEIEGLDLTGLAVVPAEFLWQACVWHGVTLPYSILESKKTEQYAVQTVSILPGIRRVCEP